MLATRCALIVAAAGFAAGALAQETPWYSQNFEGTAPLPEWSPLTITDGGANFSKFNGRYSNGGTTLTLTTPAIQGVAPPNPGSYLALTLAFDFYAIDSWDGDQVMSPDHGVVVGPDRLIVTGGEVTLFSETFSNVAGRTQTMRAPDVGPVQLGFGTNFLDSIYRRIELHLDAAPNSALSINWADNGLQGVADESWGIDNVNLTYHVAPSPGGAAALLCGAGIIAGRRRRR
jgi:hypothetical protein